MASPLHRHGQRVTAFKGLGDGQDAVPGANPGAAEGQEINLKGHFPDENDCA
jgi:hypothetical protein